MARTKKIKKEEVEDLVGKDTIIKTREEMVDELGEDAVKEIEETAEDVEIEDSEPETYNGQLVLSKKDVEINGVIKQEITIKDGSTYLI